jgi:hypothetical protein
MTKKFSEKLLESIEQAAEIVRGTRAPSRVFHVTKPEPSTNECFGTVERKLRATHDSHSRAADDGQEHGKC